MNGTQEQRNSYPIPQPPLPAAAPGDIDPGLGHVPPSWRKNVYGYSEDPRRKSPLLAFILSGMPGLGQVYVGYYHQAFMNMLVCGGTIFLLSLSGESLRQPGAWVPRYGALHSLAPFLGFFLGFYWLYNMLDAFRRAAFYNQALAGLGPVDFPEDMKLPKGQGSLAGGVALIAVGLLLFANTALGMSLDWLEQWWPMGLVLLGAYLIYSNVTSKKSAAASLAGARETGHSS